MDWIRHFEKHTRARTVGGYRLLVLDSHESHHSNEFEEYCKENNIITLCMPPHSSHLLQPLDVGCFGPLKKAYGRQIENTIRAHILHITKDDFFPASYAAPTIPYGGTRERLDELAAAVHSEHCCVSAGRRAHPGLCIPGHGGGDTLPGQIPGQCGPVATL
jgi:hypothetical protein